MYYLNENFFSLSDVSQVVDESQVECKYSDDASKLCKNWHKNFAICRYFKYYNFSKKERKKYNT